MFVTHDIDEALKMGSRVAILRAGRLVQYARPEALLARPADDFVAEFVGADRALKRLALLRVAEHATPVDRSRPGFGRLPRIGPNDSLREALAAILAADTDAAFVVGDGDVTPSATVTLATIRAAAAAPAAADLLAPPGGSDP